MYLRVFNFRNIGSPYESISLTNLHTYFLRHRMDHRKTLRFIVEYQIFYFLAIRKKSRLKNLFAPVETKFIREIRCFR